MSDVTEFTYLDTEEMHLVGAAANGFDALLAKARDALDETVDGEIHKAESAVYKKDYSAEDRRRMAREGNALPNDSYPIADAEDLHNAAVLARSGHGDVAGAKRLIARRAKELGVSNPLDDDAEKQTAPDKAVPEGEAESQTREVADPEPAGPSPEPGDHGEPRDVSFPHGPSGDGEGDTAPDKAVPTGEALSQTHSDPATKADDDTDSDDADTGSETDGDAEKADADTTPGSPEWEDKDVALGERAEQLAAELADLIRQFTEREKAEGNASKSQWRVIRRIRSLLENPENLRKVAETMSDTTELIKALGELDDARRDEKKARKEKEARKAAKQAAKAAEEAAKADSDDEAAKAVDDQIATLQKQIDELSARRPFINGAGVAAVLRGPDAPNALKAFDDRVADAESRLSKAANDFERNRAMGDVETAKKARFRAKLIAADNARATGQMPRGRFGPNSADIFNSSSLTLPEEVGRGATKFLGA